MKADESTQKDWREWYRKTSYERLEEGLSDSAELEPGFSRELFLEWRFPRRGITNPTRVNSPVWEWFVKTGLNAWAGNQKMEGPSSSGSEPCWCHDRMGQSATDVPDGRLVLIAGEHEDHYDPDFFIYNDVIVMTEDGAIEIFNYPESLFPPTDFHTATLTGTSIVMIGNLGYRKDRMPGRTQVMTLDLETMSMSHISTGGECPGWISRHSAQLSADGNSIMVTGGELWRADETLLENLDEWRLHLQDWRWERLTHRKWPRWLLQRDDKKWMHLWEYRQLAWHRKVGWGWEEQLAELRRDLSGETDEQAYAALYDPPLPHTAPVEDPVIHRRVSIMSGDTRIRYDDNRWEVIITMEGDLPGDTADKIVEDFRRKLECLERSDIRAVLIGME